MTYDLATAADHDPTPGSTLMDIVAADQADIENSIRSDMARSGPIRWSPAEVYVGAYERERAIVNSEWDVANAGL